MGCVIEGGSCAVLALESVSSTREFAHDACNGVISSSACFISSFL